MATVGVKGLTLTFKTLCVYMCIIDNDDLHCCDVIRQRLVTCFLSVCVSVAGSHQTRACAETVIVVSLFPVGLVPG